MRVMRARVGTGVGRIAMPTALPKMKLPSMTLPTPVMLNAKAPVP